MAEQQLEAPAYDIDTQYQPVGLAMVTFWAGTLALGLFGFLLSTLSAYGHGPYPAPKKIPGYDASVHGIMDGAIVVIVMILCSVGLGFLGRLFIIKGRSLRPLWKLPGLIIFACVVVEALLVFVINP